jgi:hypothetical protein
MECCRHVGSRRGGGLWNRDRVGAISCLGIRRIAVGDSLLIAVIRTLLIKLGASCVVDTSVNFETIIRLSLSLELSPSVLCSNKT